MRADLGRLSWNAFCSSMRATSSLAATTANGESCLSRQDRIAVSRRKRVGCAIRGVLTGGSFA